MNKDTRAGRMFHAAMPTGFLIRPDFSKGPVLTLRERQREDEQAAVQEAIKYFRSLNKYTNLTGGRSVSDSILGNTESPLGDATLRPVLTLKDLESVDSQVINWVGITPARTGYQFLQEASGLAASHSSSYRKRSDKPVFKVFLCLTVRARLTREVLRGIHLASHDTTSFQSYNLLHMCTAHNTRHVKNRFEVGNKTSLLTALDLAQIS
jgi:hypothetical protein